MKAFKILLLCLLAAIFAPGCAVQSDMVSQPHLEIEAHVEKPLSSRVYVQPESPPDRPLRAVILPFRMQQSFDNGRYYGKETARFFWQYWLMEKVFPVFEFMENKPYTGQIAAVNAARSRGADLAVCGTITQFMAGGSVGASNMALRLDIYEAYTGALVWSMAQSGAMNPELIQDYILFTKRRRLPADPLYAITAAIADSMSIPVKRWTESANDDRREMPRDEDGEEYLPGSEQDAL